MKKKTSFGTLETLKKNGKNYEILNFECSGRPHKHSCHEMFEVLEGDGYLHVEGSTIKMSKGETYKILKGEKHFMSPRENSKLKILVSYIDY